MWVCEKGENQDEPQVLEDIFVVDFDVSIGER